MLRPSRSIVRFFLTLDQLEKLPMTRFNAEPVKRQPGKNGPRRRYRGPSAPRRRFLPGIDLMEDRTVLSALVVTSAGDSGPGSLRDILSFAPSGSTIEFAHSVHKITLTGGELDITTNLTIDGPGANQLTISGDHASRVFEISNDSTATISDLAITSGSVVANNGGGVLIDSGASLKLIGAVVTGNTAIANSQGYYGDGGGIENDGSLTVTGSTFTDNVCAGGSFLDPITEGSAGGAIDSQGPSLAVTTSTFASNEALGPSSGTGEGNGGAINDCSTTTISSSTFYGNVAYGRTSNGGAISAGENELVAAPPITITNCRFTGNEAEGANGANDFNEKFGGQALGGGVCNAGPLAITGSSFTDNVAQAGNDGNNTNPIDGGPFADSAYGGAVVNFAAVATITSTTFIDNRAVGGRSVAGVGGSAVGGAIDAEIFASTTLTNVQVVGNEVIGGTGGPGCAGGSAAGGGFYSGVDSAASVSNGFFSMNLAEGGAGGSKAAGGVGIGGAIANGGGEGVLEDTFLGLSSDGSTLSVADTAIGLNLAEGGAGGAGGNGGSGQGGACYVYGATTATIDGSEIVFNAAVGGAAGAGGAVGQGSGGGLYISAGAGVTLSSPSEVVYDHASSSDDDIFGTYTIG
jgi:hypothetical protein